MEIQKIQKTSIGIEHVISTSNQTILYQLAYRRQHSCESRINCAINDRKLGYDNGLNIVK